jgi:D-alanine-D-alanine ligase
MRKKLGLIFGGKSAEYEVSISSAKSIYSAIDQTKYNVTAIAIDLSGKWYVIPHARMMEESLDSFTLYKGLEGIDFFQATYELCRDLDVVFPAMHGPFGEDGAIQGFFQVAGIPCVGAGVLGSAVGMDKDVMKRLLKEAGMPIADFLVFKRGEKSSYREIAAHLGERFFIKPANMGSSLGISLVNNQEEFIQSWEEAFVYDHKIIVEKRLEIRELECSVLGIDDPMVSLPGELIPKGGIYSYDAKYIDSDGAEFILPANISKKVLVELQQMALQAFKVLCTDSMARVDFFLDKEDKLYINEINTIPGFTPISLYPKLWTLSGIDYPLLIERLIEMAIEKKRRSGLLQFNMHVTTGKP